MGVRKSRDVVGKGWDRCDPTEKKGKKSSFEKTQKKSVHAEAMSSALSGGSKRHVVYYHNPEVGNFHYGPKHPMKPHRLALTHALVMEYGLLDKMDVYIPKKATYDELTQFHTPEYLDYLMGYAFKLEKTTSCKT